MRQATVFIYKLMSRASYEAKETPVNVIPAQAGLQGLRPIDWVPACAGMT